MASPTTNKGYTYPAHGAAVNAWDTPLNDNFDQIDLNVAGVYSVQFGSTIAGATFNSTYATVSSTVTTVTFPSSNAQNLHYVLTGEPGGTLTLRFPSSVGGLYYVTNQTSGRQHIYAGLTGGSTVSLVGSEATHALVSNGTDVVRAVGPSVLLSYGTFSAAASLDIDVVPYSMYRIIEIHLTEVTQSVDDAFCPEIRFSLDSTTFISTGYFYVTQVFENDSTTYQFDEFEDDRIISGFIDNATGASFYGKYTLTNAFSTSLDKQIGIDGYVSDPSGRNSDRFCGVGALDASSQALTIVRFFPNSGTFSGKYTVIGTEGAF